jgi:hypothetical protein
MTKSSIFILTAVSFLLSSCDFVGVRGNGHVVNDQRSITEFNEISTFGLFEIEWHSGPAGLVVTTDQNLLPYIETRVSGNTLQLRTRERVRPTHSIKINVSSATLNGADLRGGVDLVVKQLSGPKFYVRSRGASDITVDGTVEQLLVDLTGASDLKAKSLQAKTVEISSAGAASASVTATETLRVSITGAGDVTYYGNPKNVEKHLAGAGSIRHKD